MASFKKVVREVEDGYIAVVDKLSPWPEKEQVAKFSSDSVGVLGLGWPMGESTPLIESHNWDEEPPSDFPGPHKLHVSVLVLNSAIVGYMPVRWHWNIVQKGRQLDTQGKPIESEGRFQVYDVAESIRNPIVMDEGPKRLECWGIEAVVILPSWQRQGLGSLLLRTALDYLGVNEKEVAYDPPFSDAGKGLLGSLGLNHKEVRLSLGI
jgi:GNAT superfamily N-acetyltransferase